MVRHSWSRHAARIAVQPPEAADPRGKCVEVATFTHPNQRGLVKVIRAWEDGSLDARVYGAGIGGSLEEWTPPRWRPPRRVRERWMPGYVRRFKE